MKTKQPLGRRDKNFLKLLYHDLESPVAYSSPQKIHSIAKTYVKGLHVNDVKTFLSGQSTYVRHRNRQKRFRRRKTITSGLNSLHQADLADMSQLAPYNSGVKFLLVNIDCFSRYAQAMPLKRKLGSHVARAFEEMYKRDHKRVPKYLHTDRGGEFLNPESKTIFKKYGVHHYFTYSPHKAALIERWIRTFRMILAKFLHARKTRRYLDDLPALVTLYNNRKHRSLFNLSPSEVSPQNEKKLWKKMYKDQFPKKTSFKFRVGQIVKITDPKSRFAKEWTGSWSEQNYQIVLRQNTNPPTYKLANEQGQIIKQTYYEKDMTLIE